MYKLIDPTGSVFAETDDDRIRRTYLACGYKDVTETETPKTTVKKKGTKNGKSVKSGTED